MITLTQALRAQVAWLVAACVYNALSLLVMANGGQGLAGETSSTLAAMAACVLFGGVICTGHLRRRLAYKLLAPLVFVALLTGGVLKHVMAGPVGYASLASWASAILINLFGAAAFAMGIVTAYRD